MAPICEELEGYRLFDVVETRTSSGSPWTQGVIIGLDNGDNTFQVVDKGLDWANWHDETDIRKVERAPDSAALPRRLQYKLDSEGTPFSRRVGEWQTCEVGDAGLSLSIAPCGHHQKLTLRNVPPATAEEILDQLRKLTSSGTAYTRGRVEQILRGVF